MGLKKANLRVEWRFGNGVSTEKIGQSIGNDERVCSATVFIALCKSRFKTQIINIRGFVLQTKKSRVIARIAQNMRKVSLPFIKTPIPGRMRQPNQTIALGIASRKHSPPAGTTHRAGREIIGKFEPLFGNRVNCRCVYRIDTITPKMPPCIVRGNNDNIRHENLRKSNSICGRARGPAPTKHWITS